MKVKTYCNDRIVHLIYPDQYSLTSSLMRVQEFYESPIHALRDKKFNFEECFDAFNKKHTGENYFTKWNGFNIPGTTVRKFMREFDGFWEKELEWMNFVIYWSGRKKFYLIGTHTGDKEHGRVMDHELAHAFYYLNKDYKIEMDELYKTWDANDIKKVHKVFKTDGYSRAVYKDELQAYYSTSSITELKKWKMPLDKSLLLKYRAILKRYKKQLI